VTILEQHLDAYGHVNNVAYISLFEQARWDLITAGGYGLEQIKSSGVGPIVLEIQTKFRKELRLRQNIVIRSKTLFWKGKIGVLEQVMLDHAGVVYCEAKFTLGIFDLNARKLVSISDEWAQILNCPIDEG
jgi:acyl-CoA thioester hydrolase